MIPPLEIGQLSAPAQKLAGPAAPQKLQEMAARGIAPGVKPGEMVALLVFLTASDRPPVKETAEKTLAALPDPILAGALSSDLPSPVIDALARASMDRFDVLEKLLGMPSVAAETVEELARTGNEALTELIATNEEFLLANARIIERLYLNKRTRMSTADRLIDLATRNGIALTGIGAYKEAALALQGELIPMADAEPTPGDVLFREAQELAEQLASAEDEDTHVEDDEGKEVVKKKFLPLYQQIAEMSMSEKIRAGTLGSKEARMLLVRDNNKIVATAAVRSPLMQENEVALIARNRNIHDDVLRIIATSPEWLRSYTVKKNLVENPKTPQSIATKLIPHLREAELRHLAKSKNVTGAVQEAARRHLDRRNR